MRLNPKLPAILLQLTSLLFILLAIYTVGLENMSSNIVWVSYSIFLVLTLPALISKVFFGAPFISFTSVMCYLYYPAAYLMLFGFSNLFGIEFSDLGRFFVFFTLFYWNYLLAFLIFALEKEYIQSMLKNVLYVSVPILISLLILAVFIRQPNSIVATDYIQHQTVANAINDGEKFCLIPSNCSNLFLQDGYTTLYHFILASIGSFTGNDLNLVMYLLDFVWVAVISLSIYKLLLSRLGKHAHAAGGTLISLLIFLNGAYDTLFFLPQTLSLLFFLNILTSKNLTPIKVLFGIVMLLLSHFILGAYFAVILVIYYIICNLIFDNEKTNKNQRLLMTIALIFAVLTFLLHVSGFSIEENLQSSAVEVVGEYTNASYPVSIYRLANVLGYVWGIAILLTFLYYIGKLIHRPQITFAFVYLCIAFSIFFLGPTYAQKFLTGSGIFMTMVVFYTFDWTISLKKYRYAVFALTLIALSLTFVKNYTSYQDFYRQSDGTVSAIVQSDKALFTYLSEREDKCFIISDPYTQLMSAGFANYETANAHYMKLESRSHLFNFVKNPNGENFKKLLNIEELEEVSEDELCFVYTSRLQEAVETDSNFWTKNIYSYILESDFDARSNEALMEYMIESGYEVRFENEDFVVFEKAGTSNKIQATV